MKNLLSIIFALSLLSFFLSCNKKIEYGVGKVEIFLIESYETFENEAAIDESSVITESTPFISYEDLLSYNSTNYTFKISDAAVNTIKNLPNYGAHLAFGVKANNELIYTGYFKPSFLSSTCAWTVIDPLKGESTNELIVQLGYPWLMEGMSIPDRRNDERIIAIFRRDGKLVE